MLLTVAMRFMVKTVVYVIMLLVCVGTWGACGMLWLEWKAKDDTITDKEDWVNGTGAAFPGVVTDKETSNRDYFLAGAIVQRLRHR